MEKKEIAVLFGQYYGRMYGMAASILYDEQESKDVVSGIFERLLASDSVLLPDTVGHYLLTSVRNASLKRIAQRESRQRFARQYAIEQRQAASEEQAKSARLFAMSPEEDEGLLERMIRFAQTRLTDQQQRIFRMRFLGGMKYEEIGEELGISRVAVWKHLSHITTIIKEQFKDSEL